MILYIRDIRKVIERGIFMTFFRDENGQGMVEYALILGLIALVAVVTIAAISSKNGGLFVKANEALDNVPA